MSQNKSFGYQTLKKMSKACLKKREKSATLSELSHVMRKPVYAIFQQQRRRSACASAQSARSLISTFVVGCLETIIPETFTCYIHNFRTLASLWSGVGLFESYVIENTKDRFSRDEAQFRVPEALLSLRTSKFWNKIWLADVSQWRIQRGFGGFKQTPSWA